MQVIQVKDIVTLTAAFVGVRFNFKNEKGVIEGRQVVLPALTAPGVGDLAVFISNKQNRPRWMRSPLLCYHGSYEAMGRRNDGGLWPCRQFLDKDGVEVIGWALVTPRMTDDPLFQRWVNEYDDLSDVLPALSF